MNAERPAFEQYKAAGPQLDMPMDFPKEAVATKTPDVVTAVTPVVEAKSIQQTPTGRQLFWRNMYQTGEMSPYKKNKGPIKFDALKKAAAEAFAYPVEFIKHRKDHVRAVDIDFRGGRDAGEAKERAQRVGVLLLTMFTFMGFDAVTGRIWKSKMAEYFKKRGTTDLTKDPAYLGLKKAVEVGNDKYTTGLADLMVWYLTKEKGGFVREASDRVGDFLNIAMKEPLDDIVNGVVTECVLRMLYQIPISGALIEQGWANFTALLEKSNLSKSTGKLIFRGFGTYLWYRGIQMKQPRLDK